MSFGDLVLEGGRPVTLVFSLAAWRRVAHGATFKPLDMFIQERQSSIFFESCDPGFPFMEKLMVPDPCSYFLSIPL